jgi:uncharacterized protein YndB with AHSA1/START domain
VVDKKEKAQMKAQKSIDIAASPEKIWPYLIEPEDILKWCITFLKFEYTGEQRSGVGTTFYVEEKAGGPLMKLNFRITDWVVNEKVAFSMISGNFVKDYEQSWTIGAIPSGSRFTFWEEVTMPYGIIGKIIGALGEGSSQATVEKMLLKLKSLAET